VLEIQIEGQSRTVNSYHRFGARSTRDPLEAWGQARDGVVKAVRHRQLPLAGIMWHPEREFPFHSEDVAYMEQFFRP
jgi:putative glutamine amidotransferase